MAHNENFADENPQHCVDERREHALAVTESVAFEEFDRWMDVALARLVDRLDQNRGTPSRPATILGSALRRKKIRAVRAKT